MPLYFYTARSAEGATLRGSIEGASDAVALAALRTRSLTVTSLDAAGTTGGIVALARSGGALNEKDLATFFRSFGTLVKCGIDVRRALEVTIAQTVNARLSEALRSVLNDIENGMALSDAMERRPREFRRLFVSSIRAGEFSGTLDDVVERLASLLEKQQASRKRLFSALAYPAVVLIAAGGVVVFLVCTIVPTFATMYDQMRVPVPPVTRALVSLGWALRDPVLWTAIAGVFAAAAAYARSVRRIDSRRRWMDAARLRVPVLGTILRKTVLARLARTLGTLLHSGVPMTLALDVAAEVAGNAVYERNIGQVSDALRDGHPFTGPIADSGLYEPMFVQLVRVGEETGRLDAMLVRVAEYYELDVETALATLGSIIEPMLIIVLGGAVAFIVAAIFVPLYALIGNIK